MSTLGNQFNCPDCGTPFYNENGYEPHSHGEAIPIDPRGTLDMANMFRTRADLDNVERTRKVDLSNKTDLLNHLSSSNGHMMGPYAGWRATYVGEGPKEELGETVPGVRNYRGDDFELTHAELKTLHDHLHRVWGEPHLTQGDEHYHV